MTPLDLLSERDGDTGLLQDNNLGLAPHDEVVEFARFLVDDQDYAGARKFLRRLASRFVDSHFASLSAPQDII